eukprot:gene5558-6921_t
MVRKVNDRSVGNPSEIPIVSFSFESETELNLTESIDLAPYKEIVLQGYTADINNSGSKKTFVIQHYFRALPLPIYPDIPATNPTSPPKEGSTTFYKVDSLAGGCELENCTVLLLNEVNHGNNVEKVQNLTHPYVGMLMDKSWLNYIVLGKEDKSTRALVEATIKQEKGKHSAVVYRIYVHLPDPDPPGCPVFDVIPCKEGTTLVYKRNEKRCLIPDGCVSRGPCPLFVPHPPPGYTLVSFPSRPKACPHYLADASFLTNTKHF